MWCDIRTDNLVFCPKCNNNLTYVLPSFDSITKCDNCHNFKSLLKCRNTICKFQKVLCRVCDVEEFSKLRNSVQCNKKFQTLHKKRVDTESSKLNVNYKLSALLILVAFIVYCFISCSETLEDKNINCVKMLRKHYPLQKNETWYHIMSVLEKKNPTVKTITFLYGEDRRTSDCLAKELIFLYTENKDIKSEEITFSHFGYEIKDYGVVLEHYRPIIKKFKIFITDLNKITGNIARIFHTLCDEVSSDIKPSLFIFTLKYENEQKNMKPVERATTVLKKLWNDLPEHEIFPLLSRVIKNVVETLPEERVLC